MFGYAGKKPLEIAGCAVEAQWKRSGCAVEAQCYDCCDLKQKKTGVPMTAPQNRPKILRTPHHLYLLEFCVKLGRNRGNHPNFAPVAFLVGTTRVALRAAQRLLEHSHISFVFVYHKRKFCDL